MLHTVNDQMWLEMTCEQLHLSLYIVRSLATGVQNGIAPKNKLQKAPKRKQRQQEGKHTPVEIYVGEVVCGCLYHAIALHFGGFPLSKFLSVTRGRKYLAAMSHLGETYENPAQNVPVWNDEGSGP